MRDRLHELPGNVVFLACGHVACHAGSFLLVGLKLDLIISALAVRGYLSLEAMAQALIFFRQRGLGVKSCQSLAARLNGP